MKTRLPLLFILFCIQPLATAAEDDCTFNPQSATGDFLKNPNVAYSTWNSKTKEGSAILVDGGLLYVKKWACRHVGMDARFIVMYSREALDKRAYWINKALWLGKQVLEKSDFEIFNTAMAKKEYRLETSERKIIFHIPHKTYSEFRVSISEENYMTVLNIYYYFG